jgi:nitroreductase
VGISRKPANKSARSWLSRFLSPAQLSYDPSLRLAGEFCDKDLESITTLLLNERRKIESQPRTEPREVPPLLLSSSPAPADSLRLPKPDTVALSLGTILSRRQSVRDYGPEPVPSSAVATALFYAHLADTTGLGKVQCRHLPLRFFVLARNVAGLVPALYQYEFVKHRLIKMRSLPSEKGLATLFVQPEFSEAPLTIWITGNLAAACASFGARGHSELLLRAGVAGHRLWLTTLAFGLGGTLVAGTNRSAARDILGLDEYRTATLLAFAGGFAAPNRVASRTTQSGDRS